MLDRKVCYLKVLLDTITKQVLYHGCDSTYTANYSDNDVLYLIGVLALDTRFNTTIKTTDRGERIIIVEQI